MRKRTPRSSPSMISAASAVETRGSSPAALTLGRSDAADTSSATSEGEEGGAAREVAGLGQLLPIPARRIIPAGAVRSDRPCCYVTRYVTRRLRSGCHPPSTRLHRPAGVGRRRFRRTFKADNRPTLVTKKKNDSTKPRLLTKRLPAVASRAASAAGWRRRARLAFRATNTLLPLSAGGTDYAGRRRKRRSSRYSAFSPLWTNGTFVRPFDNPSTAR